MDDTAHIGGAWKRFPNEKAAREGRRDAALDIDLNIIGD